MLESLRKVPNVTETPDKIFNQHLFLFFKDWKVHFTLHSIIVGTKNLHNFINNFIITIHTSVDYTIIFWNNSSEPICISYLRTEMLLWATEKKYSWCYLEIWGNFGNSVQNHLGITHFSYLYVGFYRSFFFWIYSYSCL